MVEESTTLSPDDAFGALGNETRVAILRALGDADSPLPFSELYDRVDVDDTGGFNYHLDRLVGHFVRETDEGYELARPGSRVVEAVLSGAVTDAPVLERTVVDHPCPLCGAPVAVTFRDERVELYCTECAGKYGSGATAAADERGYLGYHPLPPAGLQGRDATETLRAAVTWGHLELMAASGELCPRCSARLDREVEACRDHDASDGLCATCGNRDAVSVSLTCTNCIYDEGGSAIVGLAGAPPLLAFLTTRGYDLVSPEGDGHPAVSRVLNDYEETVESTDPFRATFTFSVDGDELELTVDEDLAVVEAVERTDVVTD